jgi:hypothetical protein
MDRRWIISTHERTPGEAVPARSSTANPVLTGLRLAPERSSCGPRARLNHASPCPAVAGAPGRRLTAAALRRAENTQNVPKVLRSLPAVARSLVGLPNDRPYHRRRARTGSRGRRRLAVRELSRDACGLTPLLARNDFDDHGPSPRPPAIGQLAAWHDARAAYAALLSELPLDAGDRSLSGTLAVVTRNHPTFLALLRPRLAVLGGKPAK